MDLFGNQEIYLIFVEIKTNNMKQTTLQWLGFELNMLFTDITEEQWNRADKIFKQAKKMEKQQGYSEEELKSAFKIGFNIGYGSTVQELDLKNEHCENWFNKFKNK
jgi:glucuronate isomerase